MAICIVSDCEVVLVVDVGVCFQYGSMGSVSDCKSS